MREKFVYPMKEKIYGWYPPAKSIYKTTNVPDTYTQECLYKHWKSRYNQDNRGVETPMAPTPVKIELSPRPSPPRSSVTSSHAKSRPPSTRSCRDPTPPSSAHFKRWATKIPATEITITPPPSAPPKPTSLSVQPATIHAHAQDERVCTSPATKRDRIKSATIHRDRVSAPKRTVKSAGPVRTPVSVSIPCGYPEFPTTRPKTAIPHVQDDVSCDVDEDDGDSVTDYDERLKKYGWRMEVHGDPLKLKRFRKRLPFTVECKEPEIPPNPPTGKMECFDTFFYNTIPRKPLSYTIHQEWMSEVLYAKRMELQKREGMNFRYKNFSFAY